MPWYALQVSFMETSKDVIKQMNTCARCPLQSTSEEKLVLALNFLASPLFVRMLVHFGCLTLMVLEQDSKAVRRRWLTELKDFSSANQLLESHRNSLSTVIILQSLLTVRQSQPCGLLRLQERKLHVTRPKWHKPLSPAKPRIRWPNLVQKLEDPGSKFSAKCLIWFCESEIILLGGLNHGVIRLRHCGHRSRQPKPFGATREPFGATREAGSGINLQNDPKWCQPDNIFGGEPMSMTCTSNVARQACDMKMVSKTIQNKETHAA